MEMYNTKHVRPDVGTWIVFITKEDGDTGLNYMEQGEVFMDDVGLLKVRIEGDMYYHMCEIECWREE